MADSNPNELIERYDAATRTDEQATLLVMAKMRIMVGGRVKTIKKY